MLFLLFFNMDLKERSEGVQSFWSFSRIYLEEKPREPQILLSDLYSIEKPGDPQLLISDLDLREPGELQILILNLSGREFPDQYVRLILTRRQESLRSLSWIYLEEYPGERQTLMSDLYPQKTRRASHDYLWSILKRRWGSLRSLSWILRWVFMEVVPMSRYVDPILC